MDADEKTCVLCIEHVDPTDETVALGCGHSFHLKCWLQGTIPTVGSSEGFDKFVEDRQAGRCPICRQHLSAPVAGHVSGLLKAVRKGNVKKRKRLSDTSVEVLSRISPNTMSSHLLHDAPEEAEEALISWHVNDSTSRLPLEDGDVFAALSFPRGPSVCTDSRRELDRCMRAQLQIHSLDVSGTTEALAARIVSNKLATRGFFRTIRAQGLLTDAQPLRCRIDQLLDAPLKAKEEAEYKDAQDSKLVAQVVKQVLTVVFDRYRRLTRGSDAEESDDHEHEDEEEEEEEDEEEEGEDEGGEEARIGPETDARPQAPAEEERHAHGEADAPPASAAGRDHAAAEAAATHSAAQEAALVISEHQAKLSTLLEMGFPLERAIECLASTGWNISASIGILLNSGA